MTDQPAPLTDDELADCSEVIDPDCPVSRECPGQLTIDEEQT